MHIDNYLQQIHDFLVRLNTIMSHRSLSNKNFGFSLSLYKFSASKTTRPKGYILCIYTDDYRR